MVYLIAFGLFTLAVCAMGVGVMLSGRKLSSTCGGLQKQALESGMGECSCARKEANLCGDGEQQELVDLAELGWPQRRERHTHPPQASAPKAERIEV